MRPPRWNLPLLVFSATCATVTAGVSEAQTTATSVESAAASVSGESPASRAIPADAVSPKASAMPKVRAQVIPTEMRLRLQPLPSTMRCVWPCNAIAT